MKQLDKPFWKSTKAIIYLITLGILVILTLLQAPSDVLETLANAIALGLPILIGGQALIDSKGVSKDNKE